MNKTSLINLGKQAYRNRNYRLAEKYLLQAVSEGADYPDVFYFLALTSHFMGNLRKAVTYFRKALELNPNYVEALLGLSITLNDIGEYREARDAFDRAIKVVSSDGDSPSEEVVRPRIVEHYRELCRLYASVNKYEDARLCLEKAIEIAPDYPDLKVDYAVILRDKGESEKAEEVLKEVLEKNPRNVSALINLGLLYYLKGEKEEARRMFEKAHEADPTHRLAQLYVNAVGRERR